MSPREEEVLGLVVRGFSNRQISSALFISEHTVQRHLSNIFEKVGVRSRKTLLKQLFFDSLLPGMEGSLPSATRNQCDCWTAKRSPVGGMPHSSP